MKTRPIKFTKFGISEPVRHRHVTMQWKGHELLGEVIGLEYCHARGMVELDVRHMNGEPWPISPVASAVQLIDD